MREFKVVVFMLMGLALGSLGPVWAEDVKASGPEGLEIERLKLEIERLKLENQRLQLQVKTLQVGAAVEAAHPTPTPTQVSKEMVEKATAKDMKAKSAELAKQYEADEKMFVLDFTNGEIWHKNIHYRISAFRDLLRAQKWESKEKFLKYDLNGDTETRIQYRNASFDRYGMQTRGVFALQAPTSGQDFTFVTPETVTETSAYGAFRNKFETPFYVFDHEETVNDLRMMKFKHAADFMGFDDVLEVYFDKSDHFVKLRWGMVDKK